MKIRLPRRFLPALFVACIVPLLNAVAFAQANATGTITGRVFNPATNEYVKSAEVKIEGTDLVAYTESDGGYRLPNVPVGDVTLKVSYSGYSTETAQVTVTAGRTATSDFNLVPGGEKADPKDQTLRLEAFVVSSDREGDAKTIQERRSATGIKNVVSADSLGDISQGNIGDFLKYLPGFTFISGDADDPQFGSLGGLESQSLAVGMDGARMAGVPSDFVNSGSEGESGRRAFDFTQVSINNIESIEVSRTAGAEAEGDAPGGSVNLRTKRAFDRKGRQITWQVNGAINSFDLSDAIRFRRTRGPNDEKSYKISPGLLLGYSDTFFKNRLGVNANFGLSQAIRSASRLEVIDRTGAADVGPVNELRFQDSPGLTKRYNASVNLEYRLANRTHLFLRGGYNYQDRDSHARQVQLIAPTLDATQSSLTRIEPTATATNGSINVANGSSSRGQNKVVSVGTGFDTALRNWKIDGRVDYSRSDRNDGSLFRADYLGRQDSRVNNIRWRAERSDPLSNQWHITQLSGPSWSDPNNWLTNGTTSGQDGLTYGKEVSAAANASVDMRIKIPIKLTFGVSHRETTKHFDLVARKQFAYLPAGATAGSVRLPNSPYPLDVQMGGSGLFPLPFPSRQQQAATLRAHPDYYREVARGDSLAQLLRRDKDTEEETQAAYVKVNSRIKRVSFDVGVRLTRTDRVVGVVNQVPDAKNPFAAVVASNNRTNLQNFNDNATVFDPVTQASLIQGITDYTMYRYNDGVQSKLKSSHTQPLLLRGSMKYDLRANTQLRFGYVESYQQPNLPDIAGEPVIDTGNLTYQIPNPTLKPRSAKQFSVELTQHFEPIGLFSVHFSQHEIKNEQVITDDLTVEEALAIDPSIDVNEYAGYEFRYRASDPAKQLRLNRNLEFDYRQQFRNLPGIWRGLGVFATFTRYITSKSTGRYIPKSASGGFNFSYRRFHTNLRGTWIDDIRTNTNTTISTPAGNRAHTRYIRERITADVSLRYVFSRRVEIFVSGKNITNSPTLQYFPTADNRLERYINPGGLWTIGMKGSF